MKINILAFLFFLSYNFCFSQNVTAPDYKWGIGIKIGTVENIPGIAGYSNYFSTFFNNANQRDHSFSGGLIANHALNSFMSIRLSIGITKRNIYEESDTTGISSGGNFSDGHFAIKENNIHINPGIQWQEKINYLGLAGGFEFPLTLVGQIKIESVYHNYANNLLTTTTNATGTFTGGSSLGIGTFARLNFYPSKHFSVGTEFTFDYLYTKVGGSQIQNITETTSTSITNYTVSTNGQYSSLQAYVRGALILSYAF